MDEQGFYVSLNASASLSLYPNNSLASFNNELHSPIDFSSEEWVVGLAEVLINAGVMNIGKDDAKFTVQRLIIPSGEYIDDGEPIVKNITRHYAIPAKHYMTITDLLNAINLQLKSYPETQDLHFKAIVPKEGKQLTKISIDSEDDPANQQSLANRAKVKFTFSHHIASLLGSRDKVTIHYGEFDRLTTEMSISGAIPKFACIYTDIIAPQYFGDSMTRLLRTVLLKPQTKEEKKHRLINAISYDKIHYVRVENNYIPTIRTDIRTLDGVLYPFSPGSLTLKLHFKRIA